MMICLKQLSCFTLLFLVPLISGQYLPTWESLDSRPLPAWYDQSKIGIFIHWGVFSVPSYATEWFWYRWKSQKSTDFVEFMNKNYKPNFTYADFANQFTAEFYDPKHWADIFKASGAKYIVLTTKHHEGFTLWPSKYSWNWNAMDIGPNRDLVGDLSKAVREVGLRFGVYHSLFEWFNPLYLSDKAANFTTNTFVTTKSRRELEELVNNYKPDVIWSDGDGGPAEYWQSKEFLAWLYNESPVKDSVAVNDRWGSGCSCKHGGFYNCHDRYNPGVLQKHKWENAMTINKHSWGYTRNEQLSDFLTTHDLLSTIAQTVSCGGNVLVNVGPTHDGRITPIYEERLRDMGTWLSINGEAIYNSKPWTHQNDTKTQHIWYTKNDKNVYSIVLFWPKNNEVELGSVPFNTVASVSLLGMDGNLDIQSGTGGHTVVKFPVLNPDSKIKWAYVLKIVSK